MSESMNGSMNQWMNKWMRVTDLIRRFQFVEVSYLQAYTVREYEIENSEELKNEWVSEWMDQWMNELIDEWGL